MEGYGQETEIWVTSLEKKIRSLERKRKEKETFYLSDRKKERVLVIVT